MSGLLRPTSGPLTSRFAPRDIVANGQHLDFFYWHRGTTDAAFQDYSGAVRARFHAGVDLAPPLGTPIVAAEDGIVVHSGPAVCPGPFCGGGLIMSTYIAGGMQVTNMHCSSVLVGLHLPVKRGQVIARVGHSGNVAGTHDHVALSTGKEGTTSFRLHNLEDYLTGGRFAASPLIKPATSEDDMLQWVNGIKPVTSPPTIKKVTLKAGQPIRSSPVLSGGNITNTLTAATVLNVHGKVAGAAYLGSTTWYVYSLNGGGLRVFHSKQV